MKFDCSDCTTVFGSKEELDSHLKATGHSVRCDICLKRFSVFQDKYNHWETLNHWHLYCSECDTNFYTVEASRLHKGTTKCGNHPCDACGNRFQSSIEKMSHICRPWRNPEIFRKARLRQPSGANRFSVLMESSDSSSTSSPAQSPSLSPSILSSKSPSTENMGRQFPCFSCPKTFKHPEWADQHMITTQHCSTFCQVCAKPLRENDIVEHKDRLAHWRCLACPRTFDTLEKCTIHMTQWDHLGNTARIETVGDPAQHITSHATKLGAQISPTTAAALACVASTPTEKSRPVSPMTIVEARERAQKHGDHEYAEQIARAMLGVDSSLASEDSKSETFHVEEVLLNGYSPPNATSPEPDEPYQKENIPIKAVEVGPDDDLIDFESHIAPTLPQGMLIPVISRRSIQFHESSSSSEAPLLQDTPKTPQASSDLLDVFSLDIPGMPLLELSTGKVHDHHRSIIEEDLILLLDDLTLPSPVSTSVDLIDLEAESHSDVTQPVESQTKSPQVNCRQCSEAFTSHSKLAHHLEDGSCSGAAKSKASTHYFAQKATDAQSFTLERDFPVYTQEDIDNGMAMQCVECSLSFDNIEDLNLHEVLETHGTMLYKCPECSTPFGSLAELLEHVEKEETAPVLGKFTECGGLWSVSKLNE